MKKVRFVFKRTNILPGIIISLILLFGVYSFAAETFFFFSSEQPLKLGSAFTPDKDSLYKITSGKYVEIEGVRSIQGGVIKKGFFARPYMIYYFLGSPDFMIVEPKSGDAEKDAGAKKVDIKGRIYLVKGDEKLERIRVFFQNVLGVEMNPEGYVINAGEVPGDNIVAPIGFSVMLFLFILNIFFMIKKFRDEKNTDFNEFDGN